MRNIVITNEGRESVNSLAAFKFYRENAKHRTKENFGVLYQYKKVVTAFYSKIGRDLVDKDGGVFIKKLGYFTIVMHPKKQVIKVPYLNKEYANFKTGNHLYLPMFFGIDKRNPLLNLWVMDRTFSRSKVKERLHKALISGKIYKTYLSTLSSLYLLKSNK